LTHALAFDRHARTSTVERFMKELRDVPPSPTRWRTPAAVLAALLVSILLAVGYWMWRKTPEVRLPVASQPQVATAKAPAWPPGKVFQDCPTCPLIMVLPPGRFDQGADAGDAKVTRFEVPRHAVSIAYPLGMGIHEVTRGEFKVFVEDTNRDMRGCETYDGAWRRRARMNWNDAGYPQSAQHPVTCVSWNDAKAYVEWLSASTGHRYRLPSASEWEYAARTGPGPLCSQANVADQTAAKLFPGWQAQPCSDGYVYTAPAGSFAPNEFGLRDMLGNVFEWTEDCWQEDYAHVTSDGSPQLQGDCAQREMRGGSWFTAPDYVRTSYRNHFDSDDRSASVGFRVVRVLGE
jgi:formylglycine-generating enzyme required for sulfatase activity